METQKIRRMFWTLVTEDEALGRAITRRWIGCIIAYDHMPTYKYNPIDLTIYIFL